MRPTDLTRREKQTLKRMSSEPEYSERVALRAQMILLHHRKHTVSFIAEELNTSRGTVSLWIRRFQERGLDGLQDEERSGRPPIYPEECVKALFDVIKVSPRKLGLPKSRWSVRSLESYLNTTMGYSIKRSRIHMLLRERNVAARR